MLMIVHILLFGSRITDASLKALFEQGNYFLLNIDCELWYFAGLVI